MAVDNGHIDIVKDLIAHNADINMKKSNGETAILEAAEKARADMVVLLLEHGAEANDVNDKGNDNLSSNLFKLRKLSNSDSEDTTKVEINFDLLF